MKTAAGVAVHFLPLETEAERRGVTMDLIISVNNTINTIAWVYILLACVLGGGLYLTIRTGFLQFRKFGYAMKNTIGKIFHRQEAGAGAVTPFQAVTTALAATVGTGNIVGTSQAIALGGYGAVFWMWVVALFGMVIKYSEVVLAIRYRERDTAGDWVGGPMYYIKNGLGKSWKWLAGLFAVFGALAAFGIGNMSQANSIASSITPPPSLLYPPRRARKERSA
jgi:AGCS family alanine or glycine:cation symporter